MLIFVESKRDLTPPCNVSPFVRTARIQSQIQFRVKRNVINFGELSKVRGLGLLIEKITFWSKNLPVEGTEGAYRGIHISPAIRFEAANCRWKWQNYFENLERQFVSKFDVQETPYVYKPKFAPRLIIQICARSALSLITWLLNFFCKGKRKANLMEDGAQEKLYDDNFKFASRPYHVNLRTKQIVIDIMKLFESSATSDPWSKPNKYLTPPFSLS